MTSGYASVNGLKMYFEIEGSGDPLLFLPPAFGFAGMKSFPTLAQNHSVITLDFQAHGRTADIPDRPLSLQQHAEDVIGLMQYLGLEKVDVFGESYGGTIATIMAILHPERVRRVATYGATFGPPKEALNWEMLRTNVPPEAASRAFRYQKECYEKVAADPAAWVATWKKVVDVQRKDFTIEELASVRVPLLIALGDHDFVRLEHALETFRHIPMAELAIIPDAGHFALFSEPDRVIPIVKHFLEKSERRVPLATGETGYFPGETR